MLWLSLPVVDDGVPSNATAGTAAADAAAAHGDGDGDGDGGGGGGGDDGATADGDVSKDGEGEGKTARWCGACPAAAPRSAAAAGQPARRPLLIVFNRVPKCGSTSFEAIVQQQARERGFGFERSKDYVHNRLEPAEQRELVRTAVGLAKRRPTLYDRHVLHVDFALHGAGLRPAYINLLRDPMRMQLSDFYYWRQCACVTHQSFCRAAWPLKASTRLCAADFTIDEAYANVSRAAPTVGLMTRWFCGHDRACAGAEPQPARAREASVRLAMRRLAVDYLWVGVLERLEDSLRLLAKLLPHYFGGLAVERVARERRRPRTNASAYGYPEPSAETLHKIAVENENDVRLYRFALRLLDCRLGSCAVPTGDAAATPPAPFAMGRAQVWDAQSRLAQPPVTEENAAARHLLRRRHHVGA